VQDGSTSPAAADVAVSAATGIGLEALRHAAAAQLLGGSHARTELLASSSVRCRNSLERALGCLQRALAAANQQLGDELLSVELRTALQELAEVLGEVCTDDLLDHIFSRFCIGK
jgi:tRNA modification GTPase